MFSIRSETEHLYAWIPQKCFIDLIDYCQEETLFEVKFDIKTLLFYKSLANLQVYIILNFVYKA